MQYMSNTQRQTNFVMLDSNFSLLHLQIVCEETRGSHIDDIEASNIEVTEASNIDTFRHLPLGTSNVETLRHLILEVFF